MGSPKTRGRAVFVIGLFAERPSATRHPALARWGDLRRRGEPGCDCVHAPLAQSVSGMGVAFVESGRLRPAVERLTIRIGGLASGCRNHQKDQENRMNPMKIMSLCAGPPKTLTSPDNGVRCVRGRPLRADEPRTLTSERLFAGPFHPGVAGQASPPAGQRQRVLRGERVERGVAVTAAIAPAPVVRSRLVGNRLAGTPRACELMACPLTRTSHKLRLAGSHPWARDADGVGSKSNSPVSCWMTATHAQPFIMYPFRLRGKSPIRKVAFRLSRRGFVDP